MINLIANEELRRMGCQRKGMHWIPPDLAKEEYKEIIKKFYSYMIPVEVTINPERELKSRRWDSRVARLVGGYVVASTLGRDEKAEIYEGVAVIKGQFMSGGSRKNFSCDHTSELVIRLWVSKNSLNLLDEEQKEGLYTYKTLGEPKKENTTLDSLSKRKQQLQAELEKIEEEISNLGSE